MESKNKRLKLLFQEPKGNLSVVIRMRTSKGYIYGIKTIKSNSDISILKAKMLKLISGEEAQGKGEKIKITIRNKETKEEKSEETMIKTTGKDPKETIARIKKKITQVKGIKDPKENKYYILITNLETAKSDTKLLSLIAKNDNEKTFETLKELIEKAIENNKNDEIIFSNTKPNKKSHEIKIFKNYKTKKPSKTFRIRMQNYSSNEIKESILSEMVEKKKN